MNNIYFVLSEILECGGLTGEPPENYRIAEIVIAKNRSQAIYLALQEDDCEYWNDVKGYPKFRTELKLKNVPYNPQVIKENVCDFLKLNNFRMLEGYFWSFKSEFMDYSNYIEVDNED